MRKWTEEELLDKYMSEVISEEGEPRFTRADLGKLVQSAPHLSKRFTRAQGRRAVRKIRLEDAIKMVEAEEAEEAAKAAETAKVAEAAK